mmetsp:Transcript_117693/g.285557  ORF Transcript_117693/g.285557 Transcript_117693/m.285557 type:complete len:317 (-) Transcript_117693:213-1163(-)
MFCLLRQRPAAASPRDDPATTGSGQGVQGRHERDAGVPGPRGGAHPQLRPDGLRVGRVVRLERLQLLLQRRPEEPRPAHRAGAEGRRRDVRAAAEGGGRALQHAALPHGAVHRRPLGPLGGVEPVHQVLRGRRHLAAPVPGGGGQRVREAGAGALEGHAVLQRRGLVREGRGLPVELLVPVERLHADVRRREAAVAAHHGQRPRQRGLVPGGREGDLALQPRHGRAGAPRLPRGGVHGLPAGGLGRVEQMRRHLWGRPDPPRTLHHAGSEARREGLLRGPCRDPDLLHRSLPGTPGARGLPVGRVAAVGPLLRLLR